MKDTPNGKAIETVVIGASIALLLLDRSTNLLYRFDEWQSVVNTIDRLVVSLVTRSPVLVCLVTDDARMDVQSEKAIQFSLGRTSRAGC
jgi:hypothetical protein